MRHRIQIRINGELQEFEVESRTTLVELLRDRLRLTGTKQACGYGACGCCTVLVDSQVVRSCLILAVKADGHDVLTIEGLTPEQGLHPIQEAFVKHAASQCGFCTPGMIMTAKALLDRNPRPTEGDIREALAGNLCRCTGYKKIVDAILSVG